MEKVQLLISALEETSASDQVAVVTGTIREFGVRTQGCIKVPVAKLSLGLLDELKATSIDVIPENYDVVVKGGTYTIKTVEWKILDVLHSLEYTNYAKVAVRYKVIVHRTTSAFSVEAFEVTFQQLGVTNRVEIISPEGLDLSLPEQYYNYDILKLDQEYTTEVYDCYPEDDPGYVFDTSVIPL